ncbi:hypothetical protein [Streptomyces sp. NPDC059861]|uniref:hypothetical protein n=1 Tax=Streptomyces sp. NPDC059861 TaxID=3346974 RepID=UPI0036491EB7
MTTEAGGRRCGLWRGAVLVWAVTVAVAGGLTLWMQDSVEPSGPYRWEKATPTPLLQQDRYTACPSAPTPAGDGHAVLCVLKAG